MTTELRRPAPSYVERVHVMGTVVSLDVRAAVRPVRLEVAVAAAADRLQAADETFSTWLSDSWASRLVRGDVPVEDCPRRVRDVLALADRWEELTGGFFSPRWRGGPGPDPTGLVKGWAAQQASDVLREHGLVDHVVNAAGDLVVSGSPVPGDDGATWRIGITDPVVPGGLAGVVALPAGPDRWAVATSGTAELGRHVVDPHTGGFPDLVRSATVVVGAAAHPEAGAAADACATALVAAAGDAPALLEVLHRREVRGFVIDRDGRLVDPWRLLDPID